MTRIIYAGGRDVFDSSCVQITKIPNGGNLSPGTYYFRIQAKNRVGLNKGITSNAFLISQNDAVQITIKPEARRDEEWHKYVISVNSSTEASSFAQVAFIDGIASDQVSLLTLPRSVVFTEDFQLQRAVIGTRAELPSADLVHGLCRGVSDYGFIYHYDATDITSIETEDRSVLVEGSKRWKRIGSFLTYVNNPNYDGWSQDVRNLSADQILSPVYDPDGSDSVPIQFWIENDGTTDIPLGSTLSIQVECGGLNKSELFSGKIKVVVRGLINISTGYIDKTGIDGIGIYYGVDEVVWYQARGRGIKVRKPIPPGYALVLDIIPSFSLVELNSLVPEGSYLKVLPFFSSTSGTYVETGSLYGNLIFPLADRRRILPSTGLAAEAQTGSGIVASVAFPEIDTQTIYGLSSNSSQVIWINGSGQCFTIAGTPQNSAKRAIVGTLDGESNPSNWYSFTFSGGIKLLVQYPVLADGRSIIRDDYPDRIAGMIGGRFNPIQINLYVRKDDITRKFSFLVLNAPSQEITLNDWAGSTVSLPTNANSFGFYQITNLTGTATTGNYPSGTYSICASFTYTNTVTSISHQESLGCIKEAKYNWETLENQQDVDSLYYARMFY